jgi:hypothetical protein
MSYGDAPSSGEAYEAVPPLTARRTTSTRPGLLTRVRLAFRRWRRSRPFWGGLLMILGGAEIALIPLTAYRIILVSHSVALAAVVGAVIAILGLLSWMTPSQNKLYGLLALLLGVVSFVTSNLGGFLIGGLVSIIGGALGFAWVVLTPATTEPAPAQPDGRPEATPR